MRRFLMVCIASFATVVPTLAAPAGAQETGTSAVRRYADVLGSINGALSRADRLEYAERILLLSSYYRLDPGLLVALISVESTWRARSVSGAGAQGLGQLTAPTAAELDVNAFEPAENLDGTARYLRRFLNRYAGRDERTQYGNALAAYNAGPGAVARFGGVPPYAETQAYVRNVLGLWSSLRSRLGGIPTRERITVVTASMRPGAAPARASARRTSALPIWARPVARSVPARAMAPSAAHAAGPAPAPVIARATAPAAAPVFARAAPPVTIPAGMPAVKKRTRAALPSAIRVAVADRRSAHLAKRAVRPGALGSIALRAPQRILEGRDIPVDVRATGLHRLTIVAKIGPTVIEERSFGVPAHHVVLRAPPVVGDSRIITVRAYAPGFRRSETIVVTVPERPGAPTGIALR